LILQFHLPFSESRCNPEGVAHAKKRFKDTGGAMEQLNSSRFNFAIFAIINTRVDGPAKAVPQWQ